MLHSVWLATLKGSNMGLHSYTFVFSLQETDEILTFDNANCVIEQEQFDGFLFVNHDVKNWLDSMIYSVQEPSNGEVSPVFVM
jgi:hypothetical protein